MQEQDPVSSELWINMLHGAERESVLHGLSVIPRQAGRNAVMPALEPSVVGLILAVHAPDLFLPWAARSGLPVACGGYGAPLSAADHVLGADWEGGHAVAQHLLRLGHRHIGFVRGMSGMTGRDERWRGLKDGAAGGGPEVLLKDIPFAEPGGFRSAFIRDAEAGFAPTALFCAHDGLAITVISELMQLGISVPDDVSVVGFNDFVCAMQIVPQLTTVRIPQEALGAALVRCIAARLSPTGGIALPPLRLILIPELVERKSSSAAAAPRWRERVVGRGTDVRVLSGGDAVF